MGYWSVLFWIVTCKQSGLIYVVSCFILFLTKTSNLIPKYPSLVRFLCGQEVRLSRKTNIFLLRCTYGYSLGHIKMNSNHSHKSASNALKLVVTISNSTQWQYGGYQKVFMFSFIHIYLQNFHSKFRPTTLFNHQYCRKNRNHDSKIIDFHTPFKNLVKI